MYPSNSIPNNFKYLHEDGTTSLFLDIEKPDGVSLTVEAYGFAVCERQFEVPSYWDFNGEDLLRSSMTPEIWVRLDEYRIIQRDKPKRALTDRSGRVIVRP